MSSSPGYIKEKVKRLAGRLPGGLVLVVLAAAVGICAGGGAWFLKYAIGHLARLIFSNATHDTTPLILIVLPTIGITLAIAYQKYIARTDLQHGTARLMGMLDKKRFKLPFVNSIHSILATVLTLGFGGSAGAEGPIAYAGGAMGNSLSRATGLSPRLQRILTGCGAGAGIAGIFKAPVAGVLFTLEVLKLNLNTLSVLALVVSGISGGLTCYILTGYSFDVQFLPDSFFDPGMLGWVSALGIFCGLYSVYYNRISGWLAKMFDSIRNHWLRGVAGGAIAGVCIALFPVLFGEGYGPITDIINNVSVNLAKDGFLGDIAQSPDTFFLMALAVLMLKVFAAIASNSAGGVAGSFTPTIFAGCFAGLVFALGANRLFDAHLPVGLFCLFGAAGAFSGIIHAPLMAIFLICEIVGNGFGYFLPLTITAALSYVVVKVLTPRSTYSKTHDDLSALLSTPADENGAADKKMGE